MIDNPQTINNKKHMIDTNTGILKALRIRTINIIVLKYIMILKIQKARSNHVIGESIIFDFNFNIQFKIVRKDCHSVYFGFMISEYTTSFFLSIFPIPSFAGSGITEDSALYSALTLTVCFDFCSVLTSA